MEKKKKKITLRSYIYNTDKVMIQYIRSSEHRLKLESKTEIVSSLCQASLFIQLWKWKFIQPV